MFTFKDMAVMCINDLPRDEKLVLALYYDEELNVYEIADILGFDIDEVTWLLGKAVSSVFSCRDHIQNGTVKTH